MTNRIFHQHFYRELWNKAGQQSVFGNRHLIGYLFTEPHLL